MLHSLSGQCFKAMPVRKSQAFRHVSKHLNTWIKHNSIFVKHREIVSIYSYSISHVHLSSWCVYMSAISGCVLQDRMGFFIVTGVQIMSDLFIYLYFFALWIYYKENNMHITKIMNFIQKIKTTYGRKLLHFFFSYCLPTFYSIFSS